MFAKRTFSRRDFTTFSIALAGSLAASKLSAETAGEPAKEFEIMKTDDEWKKILTPEQFDVLRKHGTERAGTSKLDKTYDPGMYNCAACDLPLYSSETKFNKIGRAHV